MKLIILLLSLTLAFAHHEPGHHSSYVVKTHEDLVKFRELCAHKVRASAEDVTKFKNWEFVDEEKSRCYLKCIFEQFGFFSERGGFDVHKIHEQLAGGANVDHSDETHQKIVACADRNPQANEPCAWAYRCGMCFMRANLDLVRQSIRD